MIFSIPSIPGSCSGDVHKHIRCVYNGDLVNDDF